MAPRAATLYHVAKSEPTEDLRKKPPMTYPPRQLPDELRKGKMNTNATQKRNRIGAAALLTALAAGPLAGGCGLLEANAGEVLEAEGTQFESHDIQQTPSQDSVALNEAGLALAEKIIESKPENEPNIVISPLSATLALGMLAEGASGAGAEELDQFMGVNGTARSETLAAWITHYQQWDRLDEFDPEQPPENPILHLANRITVDDEYEVAKPFLETLKRYHDAEMGRVDLASESGKKALDAWVKKHTGGMIERSSVAPDPNLAMVLANAALFAGRWENPTRADETKDQTFTKADGTKIEVPMMPFSTATAAEKDGWIAVERKYLGGFSAYFILPPEGKMPADLPARESMALIDEARRVKAPDLYDVRLPKMDLRTSAELLKPLVDLGVRGIFEGGEALSKIPADSASDLVVSKITQQARLKVYEQGTVAAAVTEVAIKATAMSPPGSVIQLNRPFIMAIQDDSTKLTLFYAVIEDPTAGGEKE